MKKTSKFYGIETGLLLLCFLAIGCGKVTQTTSTPTDIPDISQIAIEQGSLSTINSADQKSTYSAQVWQVDFSVAVATGNQVSINYTYNDPSFENPEYITFFRKVVSENRWEQIGEYYTPLFSHWELINNQWVASNNRVPTLNNIPATPGKYFYAYKAWKWSNQQYRWNNEGWFSTNTVITH
jgi:hypothetical protein